MPVDGRTRELEREYRAVVEEILELRGDDGRIASFVRAITEPGALADTSGYSPDLTFEQKVELLEALDVTERLALALASSRSAWPSCSVREAHPRGRRVRRGQKQQREYVLRRQMDVDPQGARRGRRARRRGLPQEDRRGGHARRRCASRPSASWAGSSAWARSTPKRSMIRTYLDWLLAVPWASAPRSASTRQHAREVLDADHAGLDDVKERIVEYLAVRKLRAERGITDDRSGRHPHPDRPARHGQDLDRRVHRPRPGPRVRAHVARRRARRGRDPRASAHLHRRPARAAWCAPCATRAR